MSGVLEPSNACTVVVPAYNAARHLRETLMSVLDIPAITQVIVVDDGSTDETSKILSDMQAKFDLIFVVSQDNLGLAAARNAGVLHVKTPFVCFLDADDRLLPGVEALLQRLKSSPDAVAAFGAVHYIDENSRPIRLGARKKPPGIVTMQEVLQSNFIDTAGAIVFSTDAVERAGLFDPKVKFAEDWEFYTRISLLGAIVSCQQAVMEYRQHSSSMMHQKRVGLSTFESALSKVFAPGSPFTTRLTTATMRKLELRKRASILRRLGQRDQGAVDHVMLLIQISMTLVQSKGDRFVASLLFRAILTAAKRIVSP